MRIFAAILMLTIVANCNAILEQQINSTITCFSKCFEVGCGTFKPFPIITTAFAHTFNNDYVSGTVKSILKVRGFGDFRATNIQNKIVPPRSDLKMNLEWKEIQIEANGCDIDIVVMEKPQNLTLKESGDFKFVLKNVQVNTDSKVSMTGQISDFNMKLNIESTQAEKLNDKGESKVTKYFNSLPQFLNNGGKKEEFINKAVSDIIKNFIEKPEGINKIFSNDFFIRPTDLIYLYRKCF